MRVKASKMMDLSIPPDFSQLLPFLLLFPQVTLEDTERQVDVEYTIDDTVSADLGK